MTFSGASCSILQLFFSGKVNGVRFELPAEAWNAAIDAWLVPVLDRKRRIRNPVFVWARFGATQATRGRLLQMRFAMPMQEQREGNVAETTFWQGFG